MQMRTSDKEYVINLLMSLIIGGVFSVQKFYIFLGEGCGLFLFFLTSNRICGGKYKTKSCHKHVS